MKSKYIYKYCSFFKSKSPLRPISITAIVKIPAGGAATGGATAV